MSDKQTETDQYNHDKIRAEISKMIAETLKFNHESEKLRSDTAKINKELRWYEVTLIIAATLAIVAITKLVL